MAAHNLNLINHIPSLEMPDSHSEGKRLYGQKNKGAVNLSLTFGYVEVSSPKNMRFARQPGVTVVRGERWVRAAALVASLMPYAWVTYAESKPIDNKAVAQILQSEYFSVADVSGDMPPGTKTIMFQFASDGSYIRIFEDSHEEGAWKLTGDHLCITPDIGKNEICYTAILDNNSIDFTPKKVGQDSTWGEWLEAGRSMRLTPSDREEFALRAGESYGRQWVRRRAANVNETAELYYQHLIIGYCAEKHTKFTKEDLQTLKAITQRALPKIDEEQKKAAWQNATLKLVDFKAGSDDAVKRECERAERRARQALVVENPPENPFE